VYGGALGDVGIAPDHRHAHGRAWHIERAGLGGRGRLGHVNDPQAAIPGGHVGIVPRHCHVRGLHTANLTD